MHYMISSRVSHVTCHHRLEHWIHTVCRGLFRDRGILHRDINPAKVFWNDLGEVPTEHVASVQTVFISHLLDPRYVELYTSELVWPWLHVSQPKHKPCIFLTDFNLAKVHRSRKQVTGGRCVSFLCLPYSSGLTKWQGTPFFMARAIHQGSPLPFLPTFPPSPVLRGDSVLAYKQSYPDHFKLFGNEVKIPTNVADLSILPAFRHELRHDAESTVWVLLYWAVFAAPEGKESVDISTVVWSIISSKEGSQHPQRFSTLEDHEAQKDFVHPELHQLSPLLASMARLIRGYFHWVKEEQYKHPEYLHDALQRIILNFVLENKDAPFIDLRKSPAYRGAKMINTPAPLAAPVIEDRRSASVRNNKRKATKSSVNDLRRLSLISSARKFGHGSPEVCFVSWITSSMNPISAA